MSPIYICCHQSNDDCHAEMRCYVSHNNDGVMDSVTLTSLEGRGMRCMVIDIIRIMEWPAFLLLIFFNLCSSFARATWPTLGLTMDVTPCAMGWDASAAILLGRTPSPSSSATTTTTGCSWGTTGTASVVTSRWYFIWEPNWESVLNMMLELFVLNVGTFVCKDVKNLMINDLKWVKWIDEYITLAMNDPFICLLMFYAQIKSFILNRSQNMRQK